MDTDNHNNESDELIYPPFDLAFALREVKTPLRCSSPGCDSRDLDAGGASARAHGLYTIPYSLLKSEVVGAVELRHILNRARCTLHRPPNGNSLLAILREWWNVYRPGFTKVQINHLIHLGHALRCTNCGFVATGGQIDLGSWHVPPYMVLDRRGIPLEPGIIRACAVCRKCLNDWIDNTNRKREQGKGNVRIKKVHMHTLGAALAPENITKHLEWRARKERRGFEENGTYGASNIIPLTGASAAAKPGAKQRLAQAKARRLRDRVAMEELKERGRKNNPKITAPISKRRDKREKKGHR